MRLEEDFYQRKDVTVIARQLLGKILYARFDGRITSGMIVETEAYSWKEKGCHAYSNKMTARNAVMFQPGGYAYVYLCYGIHNLVNIVTNVEGVAEAVLIRALEPKGGFGSSFKKGVTSGPGKLTKAMGIDRNFNGKYLLSDDIWLEDGVSFKPRQIQATKRIGIDYAGDDAQLPWRFHVKDNVWVSKSK